MKRVLPFIPEPQPIGWSVVTLAALGSLFFIWALLFAFTWGRWGNVTIDCGREMYVPWVLSQGKTLYRDIWYLYGPGGPYLNSVLFRFFGAHLAVIYWAGALSALSCAVLLFLTGMELSSWLAGWTAAAVVLGEAFSPSLFSFPVPYSFCSVYGAVASCFCLWCCVKAARYPSWGWMFGAASAAAAALLFKLEFGVGCYFAVGLLIVARAVRVRSAVRFAADLGLALPGVLACAGVIAWMISLGGVSFLLDDNLASWPTNYFMRKYGALWLRNTGMSIDSRALLTGIAGFIAVLTYWAFRFLFRRYGTGRGVFFAGVAALLALEAAAYKIHLAEVAGNYLFFPRAMVFLILAGGAVAFLLVWRTALAPGFLGLFVFVAGAAAVASRTLFGTTSWGYPIYYNGPVILSFLILAGWLVFPKTPGTALRLHPAELLPFFALLMVAALPVARDVIWGVRTMRPLATDRGVIYLQPDMVPKYTAAINFMKTAATNGESVLSVPEDTTLYFLSGTHVPTRQYVFSPGITPSGRMMNDLIAGLERAQVRYLIWSNRLFRDYGAPEFGVDFDEELGMYFRSHFQPLRPLTTDRIGWQAVIWERKHPN